MKKKFFIFDLDGTLIDAYPAIVSSFNFTMEKLECKPQKPGVIKKNVGWGDINLLRPFVESQDLGKAVRIYRRHHVSSLLEGGARLMPYAYALLLFLTKKGVKVAVATNRPTRFTKIVLRHLKIEHFFVKILCADRLKFAKPNPLVLNKLVRYVKIPKSAVMYVGDMVLDVKTGKRAGIDTFAVATGSSTRLELKKIKPVYLVKDLNEMLKVCRKYLL